MSKDESGKKGRGLSLISAIVWFLAAIVLFVLFIVNQRKIASNLKATGFFNRLFGKTPSFVENADVTIDNSADKNDVEPGDGVEIELMGQAASSKPGVISQNEAATLIEGSQTPPASSSESENKESENQAEKKSETPIKNEVPSYMNLKLFFMVINPDGSISRKEVTREMKKSQSPLVDAVKALITGPISEEERKGCTSLVSNGTRLLGASVKDGVATLNFSAEFEFNQWGIEGLRGQLQQIVFTATAFPTVESVQFLIDGEKKDYLGSEGVWIGTPLNRSSF